MEYNVRMDENMMRELKIMAQRRKTTVADLVRTYIEWGLET